MLPDQKIGIMVLTNQESSATDFSFDFKDLLLKPVPQEKDNK